MGKVKDLDKLYIAKQVARAGMPAPRAIGVDEIAVRKGHKYRVVVNDLDRGRPIWVGGRGRTEADLDLFFAALGPKKSLRIEVAAMDMWPFRNSLDRNARNARIVFDKFHIMRHLSDALDAGRRTSTCESPKRIGRSSKDQDDEYLNLKIVAAFLPPLPQHASSDPL